MDAGRLWVLGYYLWHCILNEYYHVIYFNFYAKDFVLRTLDAGTDIGTCVNYTTVNIAASKGYWDIVLELINRAFYTIEAVGFWK